EERCICYADSQGRRVHGVRLRRRQPDAGQHLRQAPGEIGGPMKTAVFFLLVAVRLSAHHAFAAEFDVNQPVKVKGSVTKVDWVNPHAWIYVDVKSDDGKVVNWHFELGPPNALFRLGWKKDSVP